MAKKVMSKKDNSTKPSSDKSIKVADIFFDLNEFKERPITENGIKRILNEMYVWAQKDPKAFKIGPFLRELGVSHSTWEKWLIKFDFMEEVYREILACIGDRREIGALENKLNANIVSYTMPRYDKSWKEMAEWRNALKIEQAKSQPENQVVVIERYPERTPEQVAAKARKQGMTASERYARKNRDE